MILVDYSYRKGSIAFHAYVDVMRVVVVVPVEVSECHEYLLMLYMRFGMSCGLIDAVSLEYR